MNNKENEKDTLRERMKEYEKNWNSTVLDKTLPIYARIDGRHFSSLTRNMGYPYSVLYLDKHSPRSSKFYHATAMYHLMQNVAKDLLDEFNADVVETHSDEISLGWKDGKKIPFEGQYFKLVSNMASYATASFMHHLHEFTKDGSFEYVPEYVLNEYPSFDCRILNVPDLMELINCFVWRQNDCIRGIINQLSQCFFTHKELLGKTVAERLEMLKGIGFGKYLESEEFTNLKMGSFFHKKSVVLPIEEKYKKFHPNETTMIRSKTFRFFPGRLSSSNDKINCLFEN